MGNLSFIHSGDAERLGRTCPPQARVPADEGTDFECTCSPIDMRFEGGLPIRRRLSSSAALGRCTAPAAVQWHYSRCRGRGCTTRQSRAPNQRANLIACQILLTMTRACEHFGDAPFWGGLYGQRANAHGSALCHRDCASPRAMRRGLEIQFELRYKRVFRYTFQVSSIGILCFATTSTKLEINRASIVASSSSRLSARSIV